MYSRERGKMQNILDMVIDRLPVYSLAFTRISSMFIISPVFGNRNIPARYKISFAFVLTIIAVPPILTGVNGPLIIDDLANMPTLAFVVSILKEMIAGGIMGFATFIFLGVAFLAGQVIDVSMGLGIGSIFDPQTRTQMPISGTLLNTAIFVYFIVSNGHLRLIRILNYSFVSAPLGQVTINSSLMMLLAEQFILTFSLAVSLMLPIIAMTFIIETGMGILARAIPQLHAYLVGIPLKILVGFSVLLFLQPLYITFCDNVFNRLFSATEQIAFKIGG